AAVAQGAAGGERALALTSEPGAGDRLAATYTVWYRPPGRRWTGISGLSYYHACRMRDDYRRRGWSAYVEREYSRRSVRPLLMLAAETDTDERGASARPAVRSRYYVEYTYYAKYPNGRVRRLSSGSAGPFST